MTQSTQKYLDKLSYEYLVVKLAINGLMTNKFRSFLTMLGIIIGVSSVISIISIGEGAKGLITNTIKQMGTDVIAVLPGASDDKGPPASVYGIVITTLNIEDAKAIERIPHVTDVAGYTRGSTEISYKTRSLNGTMTGVSYNFLQVENRSVYQGRFFTQNEESGNEKVAVIGAELKKELFPLTDPINEKIKIKDELFKVIGVLESKGSSLAQNYDNQVFIPLELSQKIILGTSHLSMIRIRLDDEKNVDITLEQIKKILRNRHNIKVPGNEDFSVRSLSKALDTFNQISLAIKFFLACIAAISLLVGGIGITNIMLMTVKERTREIGLRKAIGAKPLHIRNQFLLESTVLTILGGLIGTILGIIFSYFVSVIVGFFGYDWSFHVPVYSIFLSILVSMFIGLSFGSLPAIKASRLNPIDALRYE